MARVPSDFVAELAYGIDRAPEDFVDREFLDLFRPGFLAPIQTPAIWPAVTVAGDAHQSGFANEARQMPANGAARHDDIPTGKVFINEFADPLHGEIEGGFQISVGNLFGGQFAVEKVNRVPFLDWSVPNSVGRGEMAGEGDGERLEAL